jgi:hypothetical protein
VGTEVNGRYLQQVRAAVQEGRLSPLGTFLKDLRRRER